MKFIALLVALVATVAAANEDPLRNALMMQTKEKLFEIAQKAGIHGYDEDTEIDTMRKLVYEHAQQEKAEGMVRKRWDGTDMPAKAKAPAAAKASAKAEKPKAALPSDMSSRVFAKLDADQDGKLSRAEMQPMIDTTNAAAEAAGEAVPSDFFGSLDKDKDGSVDRVEADAFFQGLHAKAATPGAAAASATGDGRAMSAALFKAMDKDGSKDLSRDELGSIMAKANEANKANGLPEVDFYETMDKNNDGAVTEDESREFFTAMTEAASKATKDEL